MIYVYAILVLAGLGGALAILLLIAERFLANYGPCTISVNDEKPFIIEGGCTLLEALYRERIYVPSACGGKGTCGFCKAEVISGGGPVLPTELPCISTEEREMGARLTCQVKVKENLVLHVRDDYLNVQEFRAAVSRARMVTPGTREIGLKLIEPREIDFHPGQYVQIRLPGGEEMIYRAYSISSSPDNRREIELLVRLVPGGLGSTYLHSLRVGDEVTFIGPYGEFELDEDLETEIICVGGGCGLAPMRSILKHTAQVAPHRNCWLFFGARTHEDLMYLAEFKKLAEKMPNLRVHYALSEPKKSPDWAGETGHIHSVVARHLPKGKKRQAFVCGPPVMVEATLRVLQEKEVSEEQIFHDEF
ncbi:MAG: FAD-binding oxidoreductase [Planctomycetota bacterium]|jgi:Na+-transporting NADH:ubiquinone oxidoreductase subunit F